MNIVVLGAGAVGCYYAARLALAGQRVTLIARPAQLQVMQAQGLRLIMNGAVHTAWPALSAEVASAAQADVLVENTKPGTLPRHGDSSADLF